MPASASGSSALVFEADLQLDPILDDLAVLDGGRRFHDLHRLDIAHRLRRRGDRLPGSVTPRSWARPDHLADDDDAHRAPPALPLVPVDGAAIMPRGRPGPERIRADRPRDREEGSATLRVRIVGQDRSHREDVWLPV